MCLPALAEAPIFLGCCFGKVRVADIVASRGLSDRNVTPRSMLHLHVLCINRSDYYE